MYELSRDTATAAFTAAELLRASTWTLLLLLLTRPTIHTYHMGFLWIIGPFVEAEESYTLMLLRHANHTIPYHTIPYGIPTYLLY